MGQLINKILTIKKFICDFNDYRYSKYEVYANEIVKFCYFELEKIRNCNNGSPKLTIGIKIKVLEIDNSKVKLCLNMFNINFYS
jgi:hypothetical protein